MLLEAALDILAERLRAIDGLTVSTDPKVPVTPPMALVEEGELDYNESFRPGAAVMEFQVTVYVSEADSGSGLTEARSYLSGHGDMSVRAALEDVSDDLLLFKVNVSTGSRETSDSYITAVFAGSAHVPGAVAS